MRHPNQSSGYFPRRERLLRNIREKQATPDDALRVAAGTSKRLPNERPAPPAPRPMTHATFGGERMGDPKPVIVKVGLGIESKYRRHHGRPGFVEKPSTALRVTKEVSDLLQSKRQPGETAIEDTLRRLLGMKKRTPE